MAASHTVVLYEPTETSPEVTTAAGFLAGYAGRTREAYTLDLRQFIRWCGEHRLGLFDITRTHIELYARQLEEEGKRRPRSAGGCRPLAGFYRYATEEGVIDHSRQCTFGVRSWTTTPMLSAWTATSSARSSSKPSSRLRTIMRCVRCWR